MEKKTFKLNRPIEVDGQQVTELHYREMLVSDVEAVDHEKSQLKRSCMIIANSCEVPPESISQMAYRDYERLSEEILGF